MALRTTLADDMGMKFYPKSKQYWFENSEIASKITRLFGDSATFDFSPYYNKVNFFFIDGSHSYEYVRSDTLNAFKCCLPGSVIAWHDFVRMGLNGVTKWLLELSNEDHEFFAVPGGSLAFMIVK